MLKQKWTRPKSKNKDEEGLYVFSEEKEIGYRLERKRKGLESTNHGYTL